MPRVHRSNSPTSVVTYPTMMEPRRFWILNRNGATAIIDLYATRNHWFDRYLSYALSVHASTQIQAFMDEMRFACEPNLNRWPALPNPLRHGVDPMVAEDWLWTFGIHHELIDMTEILSDIEEDPLAEEVFHDSNEN